MIMCINIQHIALAMHIIKVLIWYFITYQPKEMGYGDDFVNEFYK